VKFNIIAKNLNITELEYLNSTPPPRSGKWGGVEENFMEVEWRKTIETDNLF
jgi:hypothetical protein